MWCVADIFLPGARMAIKLEPPNAGVALIAIEQR